MLTTIGEFRERIANASDRLIAELQARTGRYGEEEAHAWKRSLPKLSRLLQAPSLQQIHLYFRQRGNLALEYQLPAASSWCDAVLLGAHRDRASAVIVELKDWQTREDRPGRAEGLIERQGRQELHPSDQVRGYTEYCRQFHSAILDFGASVHGCVVFTRDRWVEAYSHFPNDKLAAQYPIFTDAPQDAETAFPAYFRNLLTQVDEPFARAFAEGQYRQDRGFVAQIGKQLLDPRSSVFELLDNQRRAFSLCRAAIAESFDPNRRSTPPKRVIVVKGPPGSGKSAIAARLWASLVTDATLPDGDVVFATTSMSQNSNWSALFERTSGVRGATGVLRKATTYSPVTTQRVGELRKRHGLEFLDDAENWREHLQSLRDLGEKFRDGARDDQNLISVVDEAHALINPEHASGRGQFGFAGSLGPQAYHIIRSSILSVFFMDPLQGFRQRENTSIEDIQEWAREAGAGDVQVVSLEGAQFRCAGSVDFVSWIESLLSDIDSESNRKASLGWLQSDAAVKMDVRVFDNPAEWEDALRTRIADGSSARLVSTYSRKWKTAKAVKPHSLKPALQDFNETYYLNGVKRVWSRPWNYVHDGNDYSWFVGSPAESFIAEDPLCEVGCPYVVRGFDFDYIGMLWLDDLLWRKDRWVVNPDVVEESGVLSLTRAARKERAAGIAGPVSQELLTRVAQAYRILLTRAIRGVYLWIPDAETRTHVLASIASESPG